MTGEFSLIFKTAIVKPLLKKTSLDSQSGGPWFKPETALLKVTNDLLSAMDDGKISVLVLLDLSAAFDTSDHETLLHRLHVFGFGDTVLSWFQSYLENRTQTVVVH